jgi:hypothetical protein
MRIEFIVSEPFEDFEIIKGYIPEPLWRAWSGLFSVLFISEDGRRFRLPAGVYFKLKFYGKASIRMFSPHHGGLIISYLKVIPEEGN